MNPRADGVAELRLRPRRVRAGRSAACASSTSEARSQMTARMYYDNDADGTALAGQTVAVIGYGSQGHAHALNAHDSGLDVMVGLQSRARSPGPPAEEAGLRSPRWPRPPREADVIVLLVPDERQRRVFETDIPPNITPASRSCGPTASTSTSSRSSRPRASTSGWSRPRPPATGCASCSWKARACPSLVAVEQDATGNAGPLAFAYGNARRLGEGRPDRDDLQRRDRDRPLRRAVRPVRRHHRAHQGRLGDAGRGRLSARGGLLRVPATR